MGRIAERSGFGPTILAEIEEPEITFRHLLEQSGIDFNQRSTVYKVMIMPPISLCSFHSLAVHNMHKAMNVQRYEHHVCFIMLQLLCALKVLQSDGVEHLSNNFKEFLLTYKATDLKNALENLQQLPKLMFLRVSWVGKTSSKTTQFKFLWTQNFNSNFLCLGQYDPFGVS